jgi:hypothetical protein
MFCKSNPTDKMSSIAAKKREEIMNSTSNMTAVKAEDVVHLQNATAARDMSLNNRVASSHAANSARAAAAAEGFVPLKSVTEKKIYYINLSWRRHTTNPQSFCTCQSIYE